MNPTLVSLFALCLIPAASARAAPLLLSEVLYDAVGSDDGAVFVELYGPAGLLLDGHVLEGVNGSDGSLTTSIALTGAVPEDGFFVVADGASGVSAVAQADLVANFDFQNGPDSIVLRGPGGTVLDALGYGSFGAGDVFAGEGNPASDPPAGESLARLFANLDTNDNAADFGALSQPTPGGGPLELPAPSAAWLVAAGLSALARRRIAR
jgi:hypothetical protein